MPIMPVTMKDIAKELGVSVVTVSKVMRGHSDIGTETRERVLAKAKELNYRINFSARSLITGKSYQVGIIVPTLLHPFFGQVLEALSSTLVQNGYAAIITSSKEDAGVEEAAIEQFLAHRLDGLIIASCSTSSAKFKQLQELDMPFVLIDRYFPDLRTNFVGVDDFAMGKMATTHLITMGCKRIAHIRGLPFTTGVGRFEGYKSALKEHGLKFDPSLVSPYMTVDGRDWEQSHGAMQPLLGSKRPDGVFCYNDPIAIAAIDAALEAGVRIPEDMAFIGCDNLHYDSSLKVPLSSMDHQSGQIGVRAAKILLHLLKDKTANRLRNVMMEPSLLVRASSLYRGKQKPRTTVLSLPKTRSGEKRSNF
jgi:LacI family transcriptional regulator